MSEHKALKKALRQMAEGSRSAFHTFYTGSSQYVYSYALMLCHSHEDACRFMVDFYQYLYLHLPEYDQAQELEGWISRLLIERYEQLSIGRNMLKPSVTQQMNATVTQLSPSEQERVWRMLDINIHFPKEPARRSPVLTILFISALLLILLLASRYAPAVIERLQTTNAAGSSPDASDTSNKADESNGADEDDAGDTSEDEPQTDELDSIRDAMYDLQAQRANTDSAGTEDDTDSLQLQQSSQGTIGSDEPTSPAAPSEPDTPRTPEEPQEPQTPQEPALSERSNTISEPDDLSGLELHLRYGDSLVYAESN